jgi:hypothetical protein
MCMKFKLVSPKGRDHSEHAAIDGRKIKRIVNRV